MHPIEQKVAGVRSRARRLLAVYGLSSLVAVAMAGAIGLLLIDYLFKFQDVGVRLIFSLTALGIGLWAGYQFIWQSLGRGASDVAIAQRVERQFPQLGDRLSTSIEFLKQDEEDRFAGSATLRRAVITTTTADVEPLDFTQAIESRPAIKALRMAAMVVACALLLIATNPTSARVAMARLFKPFGNDAYPRRTNLQVVGSPPTRLAAGQTFELNVTDRDGRLPDEARIHLRYDSPEGEPWGEERSEPMQQLNDTLVARQENVTRPFFYRVTGGDDHSMQWTRLEVVEPPRVESLKVTLQPPAYTGWPSVSSDRQIQALRGTRVELSAISSGKLKSARLVLEDGTSMPARISPDGHGLSIPADPAKPFIIDKSGDYWLELTDEEGLVGGEQDRWSLRAVPDSAPTFSIEQPTSNQFVTPEAEIALKLLAKDDLALRDVKLHFSRSAEPGVEDLSLDLFTGPASAPAITGQTTAVPQAGDSRSIEYLWQLASLKLKPGTQLTYFAVANDYLPQAGKSPERKITIITPQELEERIAQRQAVILGELSRVLKLQQDTRAQVNDLQIQFKNVGNLAKQDIDHAQGAELNQRVVNSTLTSEDRGLPAQIGDLLSELQSNKLDSPDIARRMNDMLGELTRLGKEHLGPVERELTGAIKSAQSELSESAESPQPAATDSPVGKSLSSTAEHQDSVIQSLESLLSELAQWDSYRRFGRNISQLKRDQEDLEQQTTAAGAKTLGKEYKDLSPQEQADLSKLSERQRELARRFDKSQQQMSDMARSLEETDPLAAATLGDAARQAADRGVSGKMRSGSKQLEDNQVGQAREQQQQVRRELEELLDILSNRREQELSRLVKRLKEAESELEQLRKKQDGLRKKIADANKLENPAERKRELERLSREQKELKEKAAGFARKLERLQAEKAGRQTQTAASKMAKSGQAGEQGDGEEAGDQAEQAQKDLDEAQEQLAERRQQAEMDLAREQIARMQDGLKSLMEQQQSLLAETRRLEELKVSQGRLSRSQIVSVRDLARAQRGIEAECKAIAEKIASAEVFHLALETVAGQLGRAGDNIDQQETGQPTQLLEQDAIRRLAQVIDALKSAAKQGGQGEKGGDAGGKGGGQQNAAAQDTIRSLAEVKLMKLMQEDLNVRFQQLAEHGDAAEEFQRLSEEQGQLADLMQNFTRPPADNPEDDPEALPDLRLEESK